MTRRRPRVAEIDLLGPFVRPDRLAPLERLLADPSGGRRLRAGLGRFADFDPRWRQPVPAALQHAPGLALLLREAGAEEPCLVLSENPAWDGRAMPLAVILPAVLWSGLGTLVVCRRGALAYYEAEDPDDRCLLVRTEGADMLPGARSAG